MACWQPFRILNEIELHEACNSGTHQWHVGDAKGYYWAGGIDLSGDVYGRVQEASLRGTLRRICDIRRLRQGNRVVENNLKNRGTGRAEGIGKGGSWRGGGVGYGPTQFHPLLMAPFRKAINVQPSTSTSEKVSVYLGDMDPEWVISACVSTARSLVGISTGYVLALLVEACIQYQSATAHKDPLHVTAHFLQASSVAPFEIYVRTTKSGKSFANLTAELAQKGITRVTTHMIFGTNAPYPTGRARISIDPPSTYARQIPLHLHPSKSTPVLMRDVFKYRHHIKTTTDPIIQARNAVDSPTRTTSSTIGGGGLEWGGWLEFVDVDDTITNSSLAFLADYFVSPVRLVPEVRRDFDKSRLATMVLSLEFKSPTVPSTDRTVGIYTIGRFIGDPLHRHDVQVEIWSAPSNIGEGTDSGGWRSKAVCLATVTQMVVMLPLERAKRDTKFMKLTDKIAASTKPFYTLEFFPPRTEQGFENLIPRISRLSALNPLAISITWGAGGTTKERSLELAGLTQLAYGIDTILHLTCTNMGQGMVDAALKEAKDRGIQNVLALRGDPPRGAEEWLPIDPNFCHAIDLVKYIRASPEYSSYFCVGVAAYPDGHPEATIDSDTEIDCLKSKVDAGANFVITQLFYDADNFQKWLDKVRAKGINVPIIPGIMPIQTFSSFKRITKLCGTKVSPSILTHLEPISNDDQLVKEYGISLAVDTIKKLIRDNDVPGVHFFTLNLEKSVQRILEALQWIGVADHAHPNKLIADVADGATTTQALESEFLITPTHAADDAAKVFAALPVIDGEAGRGELNNAATWDDFPNGRFGDYKSPAYGNQGLWGTPGLSISDAVAEWGKLTTLEDLTRIFLCYLQGKVLATPFSQGPLSPESLVIMSHLERLTEKTWWTVGSQPAIDGASSSDSVVGWGPRDGYVFQKSFVEFFCDEEDVDAVERRAKEQSAVHWLAANNEGAFRTNMEENRRNTVTWGIFPGQEVVQTTIIAPESFLSWKEEAFSIWTDWSSFYRPGTEGRKVLERVRDVRHCGTFYWKAKSRLYCYPTNVDPQPTFKEHSLPRKSSQKIN
ncbi:hypothetical protein APHAL10511_008346 [Amanita phalloides]|nr:hypothetical protein APHAL10511_008346 [Amanita phalloides]